MGIGFSAARVAALVVVLSILNACALNNIEDWPQELPDVEKFITAYEADIENKQYQDLNVYLYWVVAFYRGNVAYPTGWSDVEGIILEQSEQGIDPEFSAELRELGIAIGSEWAKENRIRKIDNRMLSMWASILQIALTENRHREAVFLVSKDIDDLFANELQSQDIVDARYEELLGLELFGDF